MNSDIGIIALVYFSCGIFVALHDDPVVSETLGMAYLRAFLITILWPAFLITWMEKG